MTEVHHDIHHEFPEHRELIIRLKTSNTHFHKLAEEYAQATHEVEKLERDGHADADTYLEDFKKKRVHLKDQLFHIINESK